MTPNQTHKNYVQKRWENFAPVLGPTHSNCALIARLCVCFYFSRTLRYSTRYIALTHRMYYISTMLDMQGTLRDFVVKEQEKGTLPKPADGAAARPSANTALLNRPKKARSRHKMFVMLEAAGWKVDEIAQSFGCSVHTVHRILRSEHPELVDIRKQAEGKLVDSVDSMMMRFQQEAGRSLDTLIEVRDTASEMGQRRLSAIAILDRGGYSPVRKQMNINTQVPLEELKHVANRIDGANEVAARQGEWRIAPVENP